MRLDPRAPLVLDTRELGRRPGTERHVTLTVPAPADLGIEVLRVAEGSPVELDLRLEAVVEGVLVTGTAHAELSGECVRCLEEIGSETTVDLLELFVHDDEERGRTVPTLGADETEDGETSRLEGDLLDLEPLVRNAVVLALPFQPLCREDCPGLCVECGARLADEPGHRHDTAIDPRWAALQGLRHEAASRAAAPAGPASGPDEGTGRDRGTTEE
ncbi:MAG: hypothetical protein QOK15_1626 [Nocardioidaceae bacterium]|nr:hypothetical protein [Nocardioidaceae bacterium]